MNNDIFNEETVQALKELGEILLNVRNRLIREGYVIKDGKIYKPGEYVEEANKSKDKK